MFSEGIDTLTVEINKKYVNFINFCTFFDPNNTWKLRYKSSRFYMDVQFESLNMFENILEQLLAKIEFLFLKNILTVNVPDIKCFIHRQYTSIIKLSKLDFFWDYKSSDIKPQYSSNGYKTTQYSPDHKRDRQSHWICYDRRQRLRAVNQIKYEKINTLPYPVRLEYRLRRNNCNYMNLENIKGDYYTVVAKFLPVILRSWRMYFPKVARLKKFTDYHFCGNYLYLHAFVYNFSIAYPDFLYCSEDFT